jgi:predicted MFS family arabinose efflux permease
MRDVMRGPEGRDARRFGLLFAVVYFSQGMVYLPDQVLAIVLKERGLSAGQLAAFNWIITTPWFIKPVYGLLSDFVPLRGTRRRSYFLLSSALASAAALAVALGAPVSYPLLVAAVTLLWLGVGFTDVLTDALMVERGRPLGLTATFQSVQWAALSAASVVVGVAGGYLAERRALVAAFALVACFPIVSLVMAALTVHEPRRRLDVEGLAETGYAVRQALGRRDLWLVAGFILFFFWSPSFGPAFFYYQTDQLGFSQSFIGALSSLGAAAGILGALAYAPLSRRFSLRRCLVGVIVASATGTLAYLAYRGPLSAVVITVVYGAVVMATQVAFLDLAAKACPRRAEATFFALLMSVSNLGSRSAEWMGAHLYELLGYRPLVLIAAAATAAALLLVPLVPIDAIQAAARERETEAG